MSEASDTTGNGAGGGEASAAAKSGEAGGAAATGTPAIGATDGARQGERAPGTAAPGSAEGTTPAGAPVAAGNDLMPALGRSAVISGGPGGSQRPDGTLRVERVGLPRWHFGDLYHWFLTTSWLRLVGILLTAYVAVNALFALAYMNVGGIENAGERSFEDAFFFSIQTMCTIGYGKLVPTGLAANVLVSLEAFMGLLGFSMATGLMFAKFSRPTARVLWSNVLCVSTRDGAPSLMLRLGNARSNQIVEATLRLTMLRSELTPEGERIRRMYDLRLVRGTTAVFALTWQAVHQLTGDSPLAGATEESLAAGTVQIQASLVGTDATLSQTIHDRHVYEAGDIRWGHRFVDIMSGTPEGLPRVDYTHFHDTEPVVARPSARTSPST